MPTGQQGAVFNYYLNLKLVVNTIILFDAQRIKQLLPCGKTPRLKQQPLALIIFCQCGRLSLSIRALLGELIKSQFIARASRCFYLIIE